MPILAPATVPKHSLINRSSAGMTQEQVELLHKAQQLEFGMARLPITANTRRERMHQKIQKLMAAIDAMEPPNCRLKDGTVVFTWDSDSVMEGTVIGSREEIGHGGVPFYWHRVRYLDPIGDRVMPSGPEWRETETLTVFLTRERATIDQKRVAEIFADEPRRWAENPNNPKNRGQA